mgnify:CR=1 FL=1
MKAVFTLFYITTSFITFGQFDPNWNQAEYDAIFKKSENFRSDIYTGRTPLSNKNDFSFRGVWRKTIGNLNAL